MCCQLDQPEVGREYMRNGLNDLVVQAYYSYMVDIAVYLGANRSYATQELGESLQFHIDLADVRNMWLHQLEFQLSYYFLINTFFYTSNFIKGISMIPIPMLF